MKKDILTTLKDGIKKISSLSAPQQRRLPDPVFQKQLFLEQFDTEAFLFFERNNYRITDKNGHIKYTCKGSFWFGKHSFRIYDKDKKLVGRVKKRFFVISDILEGEHKTKKALIQTNDKKYIFKSYVSSKKLHLKFIDRAGQIVTDENNENFSLLYKKQPFAHIHKINIATKQDKYMLDYDSVDDELEIIAITVAIDSILHPD